MIRIFIPELKKGLDCYSHISYNSTTRQAIWYYVQPTLGSAVASSNILSLAQVEEYVLRGVWIEQPHWDSLTVEDGL